MSVDTTGGRERGADDFDRLDVETEVAKMKREHLEREGTPFVLTDNDPED